MIADQDSELLAAEQLDQARWVEQVCMQFERDWREGLCPRIEDSLCSAAEPVQSRLLEDLLGLELELRCAEIPPPELADYVQRFPQDTALVERVFSAVRADCQAAELDAASVLEPTVPPRDDQPRHELGDEIARGGMGVVYRCRDATLGRVLALKTLLPEHRDKPEAVWRFENEARISARLQHPGVPPVHELGRLDDGRPFLTMRLVQGRTLAEILQATGDELSSKSRRSELLEIFRDVCQTVAYAHDHNTIHRDLKPSNVMVGAFGEVQVMDWGLAKELSLATRSVSEQRMADASESADSSLTLRVGIDNTDGDPLLTSPGLILGTLSYMPPEQACGNARDLDKRADVFSLGAMLCEILTGRPPYWREAEPTALEGDSTELAAQRLQECGADRELVQLTLDCLQADREARPADAGQVAERLGEYLLSVDARLRQAELDRTEAETKAVEARKRSRVLRLLVLLLVVAAIASGFAALAFQNLADQNERARIAEGKQRVKAQHAQRKAELAETIAQRERDSARNAEVAANSARHDAEMAVADLFAGTGLMEARLDNQHKALLYFAAAARRSHSDPNRRWANVTRLREFSRDLATPAAFLPSDEIIDEITFHPTAPFVITKDLRGPHYTIWNLLTEQPLSLSADFGLVTALGWNSSGERLAVGSKDGQWFLCDFQFDPPSSPLALEPTIRVLGQGQAEGGISRFAFDATSSLLAVVAWTSVRVWDIEQQDWLTQAWKHPAPIVDVKFSHARREVVTCAMDHRFRVFELNAENTEPVLSGKHGAPRWGFTFLRPVLSADGSTLLTSFGESNLTLWDLAERTVRQRIESPVGVVFSWRLHPQGKAVAVCGETGWFMIDFEGQHVVTPREEHFLFAADFLSDGRLVTAGSEGKADIWSADGNRLGTACVHASRMYSLEVSPDGRWLATGDRDGGVRVSQFENEPAKLRRIQTDAPYSIAHFTADDRFMLTVGRTLTVQKPDLGLRVLAVDSLQPAGPVLERDWIATCAAFSPDDRLVATAGPAGDDGTAAAIELRDWRTGVAVWPEVVVAPEPLACVFRQDGTQLAVLSGDGTLTLIDARHGQIIVTWQSGYKQLRDRLVRTPLLAWIDGGNSLLCSHGENGVKVWDPATQTPRFAPFQHDGQCWESKVSPNGQTLATGGNDRLLKLWDLTTGQLKFTPLEHPAHIHSIQFSREGRFIATGCVDHHVRVFDVATGQSATSAIPAGYVSRVDWLADSRVLLAGTPNSGQITAFDWQTGRPLMPERVVAGLDTMSVDSRGRFAAIGTSRNELQLLDIKDLLPVEALESWPNLRGDPDPRREFLDRLSADELVTWAELLSNQRLGTGGVTNNMTTAEWQQRWQQFRDCRRFAPDAI